MECVNVGLKGEKVTRDKPLGERARQRQNKLTYGEQQVVTLGVCASRWTEVCRGTESQRMQQRKMAPLLKITTVLVICSIFVECRSDKVFFVICEIGLKANKSQIIHNFARFVVHE